MGEANFYYFTCLKFYRFKTILPGILIPHCLKTFYYKKQF